MWLCRDGPQSRASCDGCAVFRVRLRRGIRYSSLGPDPRRVPPITSGPGHHRRQLLWDRGGCCPPVAHGGDHRVLWQCRCIFVSARSLYGGLWSGISGATCVHLVVSPLRPDPGAGKGFFPAGVEIRPPLPHGRSGATEEDYLAIIATPGPSLLRRPDPVHGNGYGSRYREVLQIPLSSTWSCSPMKFHLTNRFERLLSNTACKV